MYETPDHIPDPTKMVKMTPAKREVLIWVQGHIDAASRLVKDLESLARLHDGDAAEALRDALLPLNCAANKIHKRLEADRG